MRFRKAYWWLRLILESPIWGQVGKQCYIGRPAYITRSWRIQLGDKVRIYPNARLECSPNGRIIFGDNISIGPNVNITACGEVRIGSGTTISANVFITDMDHDISDPSHSVMQTRNIVRPTSIGENCFIGANTVILAGTVMKNGVVVGANSTVRGTFGPNEVIVGSPAKVKGQRL